MIDKVRAGACHTIYGHTITSLYISPPKLAVASSHHDNTSCWVYLGEVPVRFEEQLYVVKEGTNLTVRITMVTDVDHSFGFTVQLHTADSTATGGPPPAHVTCVRATYTT